MTTIVFTGKGHGPNGPIDRARLEELANEMGWRVAKTVSDGCDYLIASRMDTVKAVNAHARGVAVKDYDWFIEQYHNRDGLRDMTGDMDKPPPVKKPLDLDAMADMPGWGSF